MILVWLVVLALATYRVTKVITTDLVTARPRTRLMVRYPILAPLITCDWCVGWWVAGAASALGLAIPAWHPRWTAVIAWPAIAGLAGALRSLEDSRVR